MAYSARVLRLGRRVWASPDVLSWQGWLERGLDRARASGRDVPCRLRSAGSWLLWRDAARSACTQALIPDSLGAALRRASQLQDDWNLPPSNLSSEARALRAARGEVATHCREHGWIEPADWPRILPIMGSQSNTRFAGFGSLPPARAAALRRLDVLEVKDETDEPEPRRATLLRVRCEDVAGELSEAARWARARLEHMPSARLLIVVPQLAQHRQRVLRACAEGLDARALLRPETAGEPLFAIEGGEPLARHPLVAVALDALAVAAGTADFAALSAALRSPYLGLGETSRGAGVRLDAWLREHNVIEVTSVALRGLRQRVAAALGEAAAQVVDALLAGAPTGPAAPSEWARRMVELLRLRGWPGAGLGSAEQQVRARFDELLGELAALGAAPRLSFADAVGLMSQLATQVRFEPASGDVPVTITDALDDPVVRYDGIWVAQLSAHAWPPPAAPDPFLPLAQQLAAQMPQASASGQLALARQAMAAWRRCASEHVASWARAESDVTYEPSGLLQDFAEAEARTVDAAPETGLAAWMFGRRAPTESFLDARGPAWTAARLPGGTRALELISACPFRSFAELRLAARSLPEPQPGIDPRVRGILLHGALERFWRATPDWQILRARDEGATLRLLGECVSAAAAAAVREAAEPPDPALWTLEQQRAVAVVLPLLRSERERNPFTVETVEAAQTLTLAGRSLRLKLDRVDRTEDGGRIIIDYKTGAVQRFDAYAERQSKPQLPAYALAAGEGVSAVAMAFLGRETTRWRGLADRSDRLPGVPAPKPTEPPWPKVLDGWRQQLTALMSQFAAGDARPDAVVESCRRCHLHAFCRIDELRLALALENGEPEEE
jgi:probable DNA repair protein